MTVPTNNASNVDLLLMLVRIETKLDHNINEGADHETRIRKIEKRLWSIPTIGTLIGVAGVGVALVTGLR